ncbi:hypothetical protein LY474_27755 [Myxococcus stipitatus]|uniref:DUF6312 domain-containing protein n=1 Tax=Myxococcus stipitatus TaxID=83455 RepID=UPI001F38C3EF|nr:hypothetical protein [Myxococcus stipitatus]MCE9671608.1 hypothetical protein [Myxococcus stipitatus]
MSIQGKEGITETDVTVERATAGGQMVASGVAVEQTFPGKRKRKSSKGLKNLDRGHDNVSRALEHLSAAVSDGLRTYRKEEQRSAEKKKDGALRDVMRNTGKAMSDSLKTLSKVPRDISRAVDTKRNRKQARAVARFLAGPLGR